MGSIKNIALDFSILKKFTSISLPVMMQKFFTFIGFLLFIKILGTIGTVELAASTVCILIMSMSFIPGSGIGVAAATLVGQNLGAKQYYLAERFGWESVKLGVYVMGTMGIVFIVAPELIMKIFTPDLATVEKGTGVIRLI